MDKSGIGDNAGHQKQQLIEMSFNNTNVQR